MGKRIRLMLADGAGHKVTPRFSKAPAAQGFDLIPGDFFGLDHAGKKRHETPLKDPSEKRSALIELAIAL